MKGCHNRRRITQNEKVSDSKSWKFLPDVEFLTQVQTNTINTIQEESINKDIFKIQNVIPPDEESEKKKILDSILKLIEPSIEKEIFVSRKREPYRNQFQIEDQSIDKAYTATDDPLVVWKQPTYVKIAQDIPFSLLHALPELHFKENSTRDSNFVGLQHSPLKKIQSSYYCTKQRNKPSKPRKPHKAPAYGAWYLPTKNWHVHQDKKKNYPDGNAKIQSATLTEIIERSEELTEKVNNLFISKQYKKHIQSAGWRLPKYLENVGRR